MSKQEIAPHLLDTFQMLECAFQTNIPDIYLAPVAKVLSEEMSFRAVRDVLKYFTKNLVGELEMIILDAIREYNQDKDDDTVAKVQEILRPCGYEEWLLTD